MNIYTIRFEKIRRLADQNSIHIFSREKHCVQQLIVIWDSAMNMKPLH